MAGLQSTTDRSALLIPLLIVINRVETSAYPRELRVRFLGRSYCKGCFTINLSTDRETDCSIDSDGIRRRGAQLHPGSSGEKYLLRKLDDQPSRYEHSASGLQSRRSSSEPAADGADINDREQRSCTPCGTDFKSVSCL